MSWYNKVAWSEGLFLRPQLFQQQERYLEHLAHKRAAALSPFYWGFSHFSIDAESLSLGKVVLASAAGIFSDGTPFDTPGQTLPPAPLTILPEHLEQVIHLAVPIRTPNGEETIRSHLPGIPLQALPVPPRQIPFNAGFVYFQIDPRGPLWEHMVRHGGLAMHVAGDFPGLRMELWGVREK